MKTPPAATSTKAAIATAIEAKPETASGLFFVSVAWGPSSDPWSPPGAATGSIDGALVSPGLRLGVGVGLASVLSPGAVDLEGSNDDGALDSVGALDVVGSVGPEDSGGLR